MAVFIRAKQVTDPLNERVRAFLRGDLTGYASSGSNHAAAGDPSGDTSGISHLLHAFPDSNNNNPLQDLDSKSESESESESQSESESSSRSTTAAYCADSVISAIRDLLDPPASADPLRSRLISSVDSAAQSALPLTGSAFRRSLMAKLRENGYNAGICKTRWEGGGGIIAGRYEYIDVVFPAPEIGEIRRYIVDPGFAAEFQVARSTESYRRIVGEIRSTVVARPEEVGSAVRMMADAGRRSLRSRGMGVPPWRRKRYMVAKWLGAYRRTVNPTAGKGVGGWEVRCRVDGFWRR